MVVSANTERRQRSILGDAPFKTKLRTEMPLAIAFSNLRRAPFYLSVPFDPPQNGRELLAYFRRGISDSNTATILLG
jgi:hypothetical protein